MSRFYGILKIAFILALNFVVIYSLFDNLYIASIAVGIISVYVLFGDI